MAVPGDRTPSVRLLIIAASVGVLFGLAGTVLGALALTRGPQQVSITSTSAPTTHEVVVPDMLIQTPPQAEAELQSVGLYARVITTSSLSSLNAGLIASQVPVGGAKVPPGSVVTLSVSSGPMR